MSFVSSKDDVYHFLAKQWYRIVTVPMQIQRPSDPCLLQHKKQVGDIPIQRGTNTHNFPLKRLYSLINESHERPRYKPNPNSKMRVSTTHRNPTDSACCPDSGGYFLITSQIKNPKKIRSVIVDNLCAACSLTYFLNKASRIAPLIMATRSIGNHAIKYLIIAEQIYESDDQCMRLRHAERGALNS